MRSRWLNTDNLPSACLILTLYRFMFWLSCGRATIPATTLREGLALALSSCGYWDNPACESVGLLCFAAVGSKPYDLSAVGALA
jgi:hypothetical protein